MIAWRLFLFSFALVAVFTSQSAIDLSDTLMILTALTIAIKNKDLKSFFTQLSPSWIWPVWILILTTGMMINVGFQDPKAWGDYFEFRWILTFLSIIYLASKIDPVNIITKHWAWALLILNVVALVMFSQDPHWRAQGIMKATMAFSHNIAPLFCLYGIYLISQWTTLSTKNKALLAAVVLTSALLTLFTYTRGVWIGSIIGIFVAVFLWNQKRAMILLAAGVLVIVTLLATNQRVYDRAFGKTNNETDSNKERIALWRGNWAMIQDYPVFGVGIGQNKKHLRKYYDEMGYPEGQRESHAHNQYLQLWAGTGIFGLLLFLIFNGLILKKIKQSLSHLDQTKKHLQLGLMAAVICFMVGGLTESNFNIAKNRFFFLILAGVAVSIATQKKHKI